MPKLSVCIPTYNRKEFLKEALSSLEKQTFRDFETIVLDDGSTDGTGQMIQERGADIRYYWQENAREVATTNRLIELAQTDYVAFLHSDDMLVEDALERLWGAVNAESEPVVAYGNYIKIDQYGNVCGQSKRTLRSGRITAELFNDIIVHPVGSLFPKKALQEVGGLDGTFSASYDYKMELLISLKYRFIAIENPTFMRRRHDSNTSRICYRNRLAEYNVLKDFYYNHGGKDVISEAMAMPRLAKEAYRAARSAIDEKKKAEAKLLLQESWQFQPTFKSLLYRLIAGI